MAYIQHKLIQ